MLSCIEIHEVLHKHFAKLLFLSTVKAQKIRIKILPTKPVSKFHLYLEIEINAKTVYKLYRKINAGK